MGQKKLHLQGLRTVAISAVLLFHFFPEWFPNGYLGVDQFFFLSGYLMSMMIHRNKSYSLMNTVDFLYKRVKRIAPLYYVATILILVSVFYGPTSAMATNVASTYPALVFATNLIRPNGMEGYAEKLGIAVDMFTHTWSLSLEMQFYLLFPIIFMLSHSREKKPIETVSVIFSTASFAFHVLTDSFLSFNCMLSRIWQFIPGMMTYDLSIGKTEDDEEEMKGLIKKTKGEQSNLPNIFSNISLILTFWLIFFPQEINPLFARTTTILLTAIIVHLGEMNIFLEHTFSVYVGEISYCWYLVHWPIAAHLKLNGLHSPYYMAMGIILSFFISVVLHHSFESKYIAWKKGTIVATVVVLFLVNVVVLRETAAKAPKDELKVVKNIANNSMDPKISQLLNSSYFFEMDFMENITYGYENMTKEERAQLNEAYDANDSKQLLNIPCTELNATNSHESRCLISSSDAPENPTLLVLGNSYARNVINVINDECQSLFREIKMSATPSCEPLFRTITMYFDCTKYDYFFLKTIEEIKPDVLIIVTRHIDSVKILNGTAPFNDFQYKTAATRLQEMEKFVKKKIYLMDIFPEPTQTLSQHLNNFLRNGVKFSDNMTYRLSQDFLVARDRMSRLAASCRKCELYDYSAAFFINKEYKVYDPNYHVAFFTKGLHLTPAGLERVRPLFRNVCRKI